MTYAPEQLRTLTSSYFLQTITQKNSQFTKPDMKGKPSRTESKRTEITSSFSQGVHSRKRSKSRRLHITESGHSRSRSRSSTPADPKTRPSLKSSQITWPLQTTKAWTRTAFKMNSSILQWHCQGLGNKDQFLSLIATHKLLVIGLRETATFSIPQYVVTAHGGVALMVHQSVPQHRLTQTIELQAIVITKHLKTYNSGILNFFVNRWFEN